MARFLHVALVAALAVAVYSQEQVSTNYNAGDHGRSETVLPDGTVQGSYQYTGGDGKVYTIKYRAGKDGYMVEGDHLPKAPQAPPAQQPQQNQGFNNPQQNYQQPQQNYNNYQQPQQNYNQYQANLPASTFQQQPQQYNQQYQHPNALPNNNNYNPFNFNNNQQQPQQPFFNQGQPQQYNNNNPGGRGGPVKVSVSQNQGGFNYQFETAQ